MNVKGDISKRAFTLIELMVVVIVVSILSAIAVPLMKTNKEKAVAAEAVSAIGTINTAAKLYVIENGYGDVPSLDDLTDAGYLDASELGGAYFSAEELSGITLVENHAGNVYVCDSVQLTDLDSQTHSIERDTNDRYSRVGD